MRILALTNLYPNPFQPHRAPFNRHQFRLLARHHPLQAIVPIAWTDELRARRAGSPALPDDRRVPRDGLVVDHPRYYFPPKLGRQWYGHFYQRSVCQTFRRAVAEFCPDLVFTPWAYPDGWAAVRLARAAGLPVVLQVHGSDILLLDEFPARRARTAEAVRNADGVIAVSHHLARALEGLGVEKSRIRVVHDGVDRDLFHPRPRAEARAELGLPADERVVLFVGNLVPVKLIDVLLTACNDLRSNGFPVHLAVVGQGPQRSMLEEQARQLGLQQHTRFVGAVPQIELPVWYQAADLFVLPSRSEGVPNVLLEASACGTPWVASEVGGIPEIAHLGVSRLVPPGRAKELAAAMRETLTNPPSVHPKGPKPREEAVAEMSDFLESVLARTRSPAGP